MKKITLQLLFLFISLSGYSQMALEGFESPTSPTGPLPVTWTLGTGTWGIFEDNTPTTVGSGQSWGTNAFAAGLGNLSPTCASVSREQIGQGNTSKDYLATPHILIPTNGELHFFTRMFASGNQGTIYQIRVAPSPTAVQTDPAAYTQLAQQWTEADLTAVYNVYEEKIVDLSAYAGQTVYVSFVKIFTQPDGNIGGDRWLIDDVSINTKCLVPTGLLANGITQNSANLNWANPSGATSWEIEVVLATATPTGVGVVYNGTLPYPLTGLLANTAYKYYVRALCSTGYTSAWSTVSPTFTTGTAPPVCGGNFVDSGGATGNYGNNANITTTICPTNPGDQVTITFTSFATENSFDFLKIYDGDNASAPLLGNFTGNTLPPSFTSSAVSGCLTFVFTSDTSVPAAGWIANITCAPAPTCPKPTALTSASVTSSSLNFGWTNNGPATAWQVLRLPCGSPTPTASTPGWIDTTANPYPFINLTSATCYDLYVRAICSTSDSSAITGPLSVTTLVAPPVCGGNFVDEGGPTGNYANNSNVTTIICPTTPGDVVTVTFTSFNTEANWDGLYVYDGNAVVPANQISSGNLPANVPGGIAGAYWGTAIPGPFTSTSADGCLTFVFRSDGSFNNPGWVSNVTCAPTPTCRKPSLVTTTALTFNSVILNWTQLPNPDASIASSWEVLVLPCGSPAPTASSVGVQTTLNPYPLTGLTSATCYDIYVRAICSGTDSSTWSGPRTITTLVAPPLCGGNFVDAGGAAGNYDNNSNVTTTICPTNPGEIVTVTFTSFVTEANWDGLYVYDGNAVTPGALLPSGNLPGNVPGGLAGSYWGTLTGANLPGPFTSTSADGCLTFVFRSDGSFNNPGWISNITCSPAPTCSKPTSILATNTTQTSTVLTWVQPTNPDGSTASAWEVLVLPAGSPVPTGAGIPATSPYPVSGLTPGTAYVFYVRAICSGTDSSIWAAYNFATKPVNDECLNATFAIVNQNLNCVQTTPGTLAGATGSTQATTCTGSADDDVWFTFTATAATHIISFNNVAPATTLDYAIYQGTDCGSLTQIGCNTAANLVAGTTYFIRVYSDTAAPQFTNFNLCIGTLPCTEAPAFCTGQTVTYANATNVPSLGQIGCLFTSPNPAFFFLQVNQAGPLSYLISQTSNGGAPLDVDYVAWGPFTDLNTACSGVPANPLPGLSPPLTPAQGCAGTLHACSYSAAPTEIMCIPNAQLCQVYVIMITNYSNQAGNVTFTQTNSGGGTTECFPINTFNYPSTYYCQNAANPTPVLSPGAAAGVYTSTPGLVIDSATGTIDLLASTPGPYVVTSTTLTSTGGVCTNIPSITTTRTVIITASASATIAYALPSYCNSITTSQNVVRTGTSGGTYSASPAGLLINPNTGEIIPVASSAGVYTITYTVPAIGGCPVFTTTAQVEILPSPIVVQPSVTTCNTFTLPTLTVGNYYSSAGGVGTPLDINVPITTNQTIYIYAAGSNGCTTEKFFNVTINSVPTPTYTVTQSSCTEPTGSITVTSPAGGGSPIPSNLFISEVTDANTGSLTYVEIYNGTGASVDLANYKLKFYTWGSPPTAATLSCDLQLAGTIANNTTNVIKVSNAANIAGVTPNQSFTGCGGVNNNDNIRLTSATDVEIDLWGVTDGSIFTPSNQTGYTYRRLNTATVPSTTWNPADWTTLDPEDYTNVGTYAMSVSNYQYSIDSGTFQSGTTFSNLTPGDHILVVKDVSSGCLSEPVTVTINAINALPSVTTFTYTTPVCKNATTNPIPDTSATGFTTGGTYTSNPATDIDINATTGEINLLNTTAGTYDITYTVAFNPITCQSASATTFTIVINPIVNPELGFSYTSPICQNASATLSPTFAAGFTTGGTFSSTTGLSIDGTTGVINLANSTAGNYTITYISNSNVATCLVSGTNTFDIVVNPVITPVTGFSYNTPFCSSETVNLQSPTLATGFTAGGIFTSTPGLSINGATGVIDLANSSPGTYTVTYPINADSSICQIAGTGTAQVMIISPVTIELTGGCQSVSYILTASPVANSFNPDSANYTWHNADGGIVGNTQSITVTAVGTYTVTVTVDGCDTVSLPFNVDSVFCTIQKGISVNNDGLNDTFDLTGFDVKKLTIFNRLGMKVYSRSGYVNEWGGKSDDGSELPDGTYYYIIDRNTGETKTGWIYINRAQ